MISNIKKTKLKKYGNKNYNNPMKSHETRVKNGNCLPRGLKPLKDIYYAEVMKYIRKNSKGLKNEDKKYHLDHKYIVMWGFIDNILPMYIGSKNNLEYIPCEENQRKNKNCSIDKEQLFQEYK